MLKTVNFHTHLLHAQQRVQDVHVLAGPQVPLPGCLPFHNCVRQASAGVATACMYPSPKRAQCGGSSSAQIKPGHSRRYSGKNEVGLWMCCQSRTAVNTFSQQITSTACRCCAPAGSTGILAHAASDRKSAQRQQQDNIHARLSKHEQSQQISAHVDERHLQHHRVPN